MTDGFEQRIAAAPRGAPEIVTTLEQTTDRPGGVWRFLCLSEPEMLKGRLADSLIGE